MVMIPWYKILYFGSPVPNTKECLNTNTMSSTDNSHSGKLPAGTCYQEGTALLPAK